MARNGSGYKEIIEHYFKDVEIVQAWSDPPVPNYFRGETRSPAN